MSLVEAQPARLTPTATAADDDIADPLGRERFKYLLARNVAVPLCFGLVSVIFFVFIVNYLLSLSRWVETTDNIISKSNVLLQIFIDHETGARGFVITGKDEFLEPYETARTRLIPAMAELRHLVVDNEVQKLRLEEMYGLYLQWRAYADSAIAIKREGKYPDELVASGQGKRKMDQIRRQSAEFIAEEERVKTDRSQRAQTLVVMLSGGYFVLSLIFSVLLAYWGRMQLLALGTTYATALTHEQEQNEVLRLQAWLRSGQSRLSNNIFGQLPKPILCQRILSFLAEYLDVVVGAIYISADDSRFNRIATYGFSNEMTATGQSFAAHESLIGQAAADRRPIFLDGVTPSYFKVSSGLGEGQTAALAIIPIVTDNSVNAVLELGFLRPIVARDIEFLALINDSIGAALIAASYRRRLQDALKEMQQLNDELQAQQEELRLANEELEEQSKALEESRERLEDQHAELERANIVLEEQHETLQTRNETLQYTQQLLEDHTHRLESASRYKTEFLANMSHELRTPLNSSLILSKLLADNASGNLTAEQVRFAESIYAAGNDLLTLINDVLDISKVEAGKLDVIADKTVLQDMLETLSQQFGALAQHKDIEFELALASDAPLTLHTDRHRLEQILRNLLSNAIKFTSAGSVSLHIGAGTRPNTIAFTVSDTGIGIEAQKISQIFEPFYQVDSTTNRKFGGTGLGLSISRQLAELLGGTIEVSSTLNAGSVFTLTIPVHYQAVELVAPIEAQPLSSGQEHHITATNPHMSAAPAFSDDRENLAPNKKTILIIEDEITFAHILYDLAREMNYQCLVATCAEEGFELAQKYATQAILLDMKLPDQSGMSLLARLKDEPKTRHIPVHVISAEDRSEAALQMGAIGYLLKPASREQLREVLMGIEARTTQKVKNVLVAESPAQGEATVQLIADTDVEVTVATGGEHALTLLKTRTFDCFIVDLDLPDMSGDELLLRMSTSEIFSFPPVIVHASREISREEEGRLLRFSRSIIIKGARSPERLLDEVTLFLHKVEADMSSERRSMVQNARKQEPALDSRKILVVDDDVRNIFAITSALERNGAMVEIGRNGLDALQKLSECDDIDLVLMDIMMPEMDGYEAIQEIRKQPKFSKLPIIAVTARAMRDDQERCLRAGANDYFAKPVDMDRLISLMRVWLPKIRRA